MLLLPHTEYQWQVLILDLKSDKPKKNATEKQLLNSELYVRYLLSLIHHHYGIETHTVDFKRAIVTTDKRNTRKNASYHPNEKTTPKDQYRTKSVKVNRYKEAYVHLGALLR